MKIWYFKLFKKLFDVFGFRYRIQFVIDFLFSMKIYFIIFIEKYFKIITTNLIYAI